LSELKVEENVYTTHTTETLTKAKEDFIHALKVRQEAYDVELKRQQVNDKLCSEFAKAVESVSKEIKSAKENLIESKKPLEEQLKAVENAENELKNSFTPQKDVAQGIEEQIKQANVANNPYTSLGLSDLNVAINQYQLFLTAKKDVLGRELEHKRLRGITLQQYNEIERQFRTFDRDQNKLLDRFEFKACLYSLGEDLGKKQIQDIMDKYGHKHDVEAITYEQFKDWMIDYFGVTDTKDEILLAFRQICFHEKSIKIVDLVPRRMPVINDDDLDFFKANAPKTEGRAETWDYPPFVDLVFSR